VTYEDHACSEDAVTEISRAPAKYDARESFAARRRREPVAPACYP